LSQALPRCLGQALYLVIGCGACIFANTTLKMFHSFYGDRMFEGLFQPIHLLVIFGIALLVFGPKKLPELGKGIREALPTAEI
jgi:TatA/E family protein of Tat protein translocase